MVDCFMEFVGSECQTVQQVITTQQRPSDATGTVSCPRDKTGSLISCGEGTAWVQPQTLPHSRLSQKEHHPCLLQHPRAPGPMQTLSALPAAELYY